MTKSKTINLQSRKAAAKLYGAVIEQELSLAGLTDKKTGSHYYLSLSENDKNLAKAIVTCTLRHRAIIEHLLSQYLYNPLPRGALMLHHILHISIAQILYLKTSNYAAINIAVSLAKYDARTQRFARLVNAILREITRDIDKGIIATKLTLPLLETIPSWFKTLLTKDYSNSDVQNIIKAQQKQRPIDLTVKEQVQYWAKTLNANILWGNNIRLSNSYKDKISELPGYNEGAWWVQDCASYLPVMFIDLTKHKYIADLCASPGGKTAQLISMGAQITAYEIMPNRFSRLKENLNRLQLKGELILGDFQNLAPNNNFDAVLLDSPCSSTGTIGKHCDILWTKNSEDLKSLSELQYELLKNAIKCVKIGGDIIFSNCSLAKIEGEAVIAKILTEIPNVKLHPITNQAPFLKKYPILEQFITKEGFFRTIPNDQLNMDSFFIAILHKYK